jgi:hypothetical protein
VLRRGYVRARAVSAGCCVWSVAFAGGRYVPEMVGTSLSCFLLVWGTDGWACVYTGSTTERRRSITSRPRIRYKCLLRVPVHCKSPATFVLVLVRCTRASWSGWSGGEHVPSRDGLYAVSAVGIKRFGSVSLMLRFSWVFTVVFHFTQGVTIFGAKGTVPLPWVLRAPHPDWKMQVGDHARKMNGRICGEMVRNVCVRPYAD